MSRTVVDFDPSAISPPSCDYCGGEIPRQTRIAQDVLRGLLAMNQHVDPHQKVLPAGSAVLRPACAPIKRKGEREWYTKDWSVVQRMELDP